MYIQNRVGSNYFEIQKHKNISKASDDTWGKGHTWGDIINYTISKEEGITFVYLKKMGGV